MMTPSNHEGRMTERVMAKIREGIPGLPTKEYNAVYFAVLHTLNGGGDLNCEHKWKWHATGAGMGYSCEKCNGYKAF